MTIQQYDCLVDIGGDYYDPSHTTPKGRFTKIDDLRPLIEALQDSVSIVSTSGNDKMPVFVDWLKRATAHDASIAELRELVGGKDADL